MARASAEKAPAEDTAVEDLSFEKALSELESIVERLEGGSVDLEQSIALYERGTRLKDHCDAKLKAAQTRIEKIVASPDGTLETTPADLT